MTTASTLALAIAAAALKKAKAPRPQAVPQPGANGRDGVDGLAGNDGKDGLPGGSGRDGKDGRDGVDGKEGKDGKDGLPGTDGRNGIDGKDGAPGNNGSDGKDGPAGEQGPPGRDGQDGKDGADGRDGAPGKDGLDGHPGKDGANGKDGRNGADGKPGAAGKPGADGKNGRDGYPGLDGLNGIGIDTVEFEGDDLVVILTDGRNFRGAVRGKQGPRGFSGSGGIGSTGLPGAAGADGSPGAPGSAGATGADGFVTSPTIGAFAAQTGLSAGAPVTSNAASVSGDANTVWPVVVRGSGSPTLEINGDGVWATSGAVGNGDTVKVKLTTAAGSLAERIATLHAQGVAVAFSATTAAAFSPDVVSGLQLWLDADDAASLTLSGSSISQWNDKSGNARHATASGAVRPTLQTAAQNGKNTARFTATSSQRLILASSVDLSLARTVLAVVRRGGPAGTNIVEVLGDTLHGSAYGLEWWSNTNIYSAGTGKYIQSNSHADTGYNLISLDLDTSTGHMYLNAADLSPTVGVVVTSGIFDTVGWADSSYGNFEMAELCVYNAVLSTADRQACETYLKTKWGTP
jgi:hypothetical protein